MGALKTYADNMWADFGLWASNMATGRNHLYYAGDYIEDNDWVNARAALYGAGDYIGVATGYMHGINDVSDFIHDALYWIEDNWPDGGGAVTMDGMINAMLLADADEIDYFIGLVDAFRVSLWNKPFNSEFYAALARGFQLWP